MTLLTVDDFYRLPAEQQAAWQEFVRAHEGDPDTAFRVDVVDDTVTIHRYGRNADFQFCLEDSARDEIATDPPLVVPLRAPVPAVEA